MRKIFQYILMAVAVAVTASCSNDIDETLHPAGNGAIQFVVSDFPAFGESGLTRAIGTQDEGKTAWENGDQIIVTLTSQKYGEQAAALIYDGSSWSTEASLSYLENETPSISVIYAPCYEVTEEGVMQLRNGMQLGMSECLSGDYEMSDGIMTITFEGAIRDYSRLRIAGLENQTLTVTTTDFFPAGATETLNSELYTLYSDSKGNAYLYGIFAEGATVSVKQGEVTLKDYTFTVTTVPQQSYALDALKDPGYTYDKSTNTYFVKNADGLYAWNNAVQAIMSTGNDSNGDEFAEYSTPLPNLTLTADISLWRDDITTTNWIPVGGYKNGMYYPYTGIIDGDGHKISGLYMLNDIVDSSGFLGVISNSVVKDLTFDYCYITSTDISYAPYCVAFVVGESYNSEITNCHITNSEISLMGGIEIAGVVSMLYNGIVSGCSVDMNTIISGQEYVAGVVCCNSGGVVSGCINDAKVKGNSYVGGIVVKNTYGFDKGVVIACGNTGVLLSDTQSRKSFGGIVASCDYYCPVYGSWTLNTFECDDEGQEPKLKDGMGYTSDSDERYVDGCYNGTGSYITGYLDYMNYVIDEYNKLAEGRKCFYKWYEDGDLTYPCLGITK